MWEDRVGVGVVFYCTCSPGMVALCVCVTVCVCGLFFHNPSLLLLLLLPHYYLFSHPLRLQESPFMEWNQHYCFETHTYFFKLYLLYINMHKLNMLA